MGVGEIILIIACALIVVGFVVSVIIKKKQGKHSCDLSGEFVMSSPLFYALFLPLRKMNFYFCDIR